MWIWISVMGWLCCGVAAYLMMRNAFLGRSEWGGFEKVAAFVMSLSGPFLFIVVLIAEGKDCFRRIKMEKIYWNEKEQQIMTKKGECLYDRRSHAALCEGMDKAIAKVKQLECAIENKGHKMVYKKSEWPNAAYFGQPIEKVHAFQCSNCGLGITKTKKELTPSEREALKKLKVI